VDICDNRSQLDRELAQISATSQVDDELAKLKAEVAPAEVAPGEPAKEIEPGQS
jgi:phage shock protein A